jgi:hypothetical protein
MSACLRKRPNYCIATIRPFVPIVLQKSKLAGLRIFAKNTTRDPIADSYALNRDTEAACAFGVKR